MIRKTRLLSQIALALSGMALGFPAGAHYLWLQHDGKAGHLYFGEYEESVRERSPGRLDEMPGPVLQTIGRDGSVEPLSATREASGFTFGMPRQGATVLATESHYAVKDWTRHHIGVVKPMFYARLIGNPKESGGKTLPLDIQPTAKPQEFRITFRDAPLPGVDVRVIARNGWAREATSDRNGLVRFSLPWQGQYILHAVHLEQSAGTFEGKAYEAIRHRTTATLVLRTGAPTEAPAAWHASTPE